MKKIKNVTWRSYEKKLFKNKEFLKAVEKLEPEYQRTRSRIAARIKKENEAVNVVCSKTVAKLKV